MHKYIIHHKDKAYPSLRLAANASGVSFGGLGKAILRKTKKFPNLNVMKIETQGESFKVQVFTY